MEGYLIGGLIGFSIGVALQRVLICLAVGTVSPTICEYCHWKKENEWRWEKWRNRHKR